MKINSFAAMQAKQPLQRYEFETRALDLWEIAIDITHCGVCHSDLHLIDNDWGSSHYPLVPGHEIIGKVIQLGGNVTHLKIGNRVGIGWQCSSCFSCDSCLHGEENNCSSQKATCVSQYGGFAEKIITDSRFAFLLPNNLSSAESAPLLCGGATVYSPLRRFILNPNMNVGVIGIGGLGHLALQFAKAFDCEVTAFSSSANKEHEAKQLGADHFIVINNEGGIPPVENSFDLIISTVAVDLNWQTYVNALRPKGVLCFVGIPQQPIQIHATSLIVGRRSICGSNIASRTEITDMLKLAAEKNIGAQIELFNMADVNSALNKLKENKVRYRAVLCN